MRIPRAMFCTALLLGLMDFSCIPGKELLTEISNEDLNRRIYYVDAGLVSSDIKVRWLYDTTDSLLYSGGIDYALFSGRRVSLIPSFSSDGNYIAFYPDKIRLYESRGAVSIYDTRKKEIVLELETDEPFPEFSGDAYCIEWSKNDSGFFYCVKGTVKKCYPNGTSHVMAFENDLKAFSVAPSENRIMLVWNDTIGIRSHSDYSTQIVMTDITSQRNVRAISWSRDESMVAFAIGRSLYVYDMRKQALTEFSPEYRVLWTEWLPDGTLVYTEGTFPGAVQVSRTADDFQICRLNPATREVAVLHKRYNHPPFNVRPRLSPSGTLLLFSEPKVNGGHEIKLMSIDGQQMKTICDGINPYWGK